MQQVFCKSHNGNVEDEDGGPIIGGLESNDYRICHNRDTQARPGDSFKTAYESPNLRALTFAPK